MPVSFDQIVDAFSIMWCMTLKCRTAVPGDRSRTEVRFSYQLPTESPSTSRTKQPAQIGSDAIENALLSAFRWWSFPEYRFESLVQGCTRPGAGFARRYPGEA